jgi:hypothetical protein
LSVEHNDVLFIGEVVRSTPWGNDEWAIDIKVEHTLTGLQSLMILRAQLEQHQTQSKDTPIEALRRLLAIPRRHCQLDAR